MNIDDDNNSIENVNKILSILIKYSICRYLFQVITLVSRMLNKVFIIILI